MQHHHAAIRKRVSGNSWRQALVFDRKACEAQRPSPHHHVYKCGQAGEGNARAALRFARCKERGGALLTVLWVSAALAAIAFSVSMSIRAETDRLEPQEATDPHEL